MKKLLLIIVSVIASISVNAQDNIASPHTSAEVAEQASPEESRMR